MVDDSTRAQPIPLLALSSTPPSGLVFLRDFGKDACMHACMCVCMQANASKPPLRLTAAWREREYTLRDYSLLLTLLTLLTLPYLSTADLHVSRCCGVVEWSNVNVHSHHHPPPPHHPPPTPSTHLLTNSPLIIHFSHHSHRSHALAPEHPPVTINVLRLPQPVSYRRAGLRHKTRTTQPVVRCASA